MLDKLSERSKEETIKIGMKNPNKMRFESRIKIKIEKNKT